MKKFVIKSLWTLILAVCGASAAISQPAPDTEPLDDVSTTASRYSILSDALWTMGLDDLPERLDTARAALAANPNSAEAHLRTGLATRMENSDAVSLIKDEYEQALRLDPTMLRAYALIGELLSYEGDADGVERNYRAWLAIAPNDPKAHLSYALALGRLNLIAEARIQLDRSLALQPMAAAYVLRTMLSQGSRKEILADFDKALLAGGGEARVYYLRARKHREWQETDLALADVAKALEYAPNSFRLRQLRGQINSSIGRYALALAEFDTLIALQPGWPDLMNDRCWARAMAGVELLKALADCDMALSWEPSNPDALDSRGLVKLRLGDLKGAIADYDAALKQDPGLATSLFGRGVASYWSGGNGDADLGKARALEPEIDQRFARFSIAPYL